MSGGTAWSKFGNFRSSPIDIALAKDGITLEAILNEEDLLQECKYNHSGLIEFFGRPQVLRRMVEYTIGRVPLDTPDHQLNTFMVSEVFAADLNIVLDGLFDNQDMMPLLFSILDEPTSISPLRVAYFRKLVYILWQRKPNRLMKWVKSRKDLLSKLIDHIGLYSIMELLVLIGWDDQRGATTDVQWLYKEGLIPKLVAKLAPEFDAEVHANTARALVDMVQKCPPGNQFLVSHLQSPPIMALIFEYLFSWSKSSQTHCLTLLTLLVQRNSLPETPLPSPAVDPLPVPIKMIHENIEKIVAILANSSLEPLPQPAGVIQPLGEHRLEAVRLIYVLFRCGHISILQELCRLRLPCILMKLFFEYEWHNMLHALVESLVNFMAIEFGTTLFHEALFDDAQVLQRLVEHFQRGQCPPHDPSGELPPPPRKFRSGCMGHVIRLCNRLNTCQTPLIAHFLAASFWADFCQGQLQIENERQSIVLGGSRPPQNADSDDDTLHVEPGPPAVADSAQAAQTQSQSTGEKRLADLMQDFTAEPDFEDEEWEHQEPWGGRPAPVPDRQEGSSESDEEAEEFFNPGFPTGLHSPQHGATQRPPHQGPPTSPDDSGSSSSDYDDGADEDDADSTPPRQPKQHNHVDTPARKPLHE